MLPVVLPAVITSTCARPVANVIPVTVSVEVIVVIDVDVAPTPIAITPPTVSDAGA
jgi:hypothetical protein